MTRFRGTLRPVGFNIAFIVVLAVSSLRFGLAHAAESTGELGNHDESCAELLQNDPLTALVQLRQEINLTKDATLRSRLEQDFQSKLGEMTGSRPEELRNLKASLRERYREIISFENRARQASTDQSLRVQQTQTMGPQKVKLKSVLSTDILADHLVHFHKPVLKVQHTPGQANSGVMWSDDDRFVAFRPQVNLNDPGPTQIYDLTTGQKMDFSPTEGVMSARGNLWAQAEPIKRETTIVSDFLTGQQLDIWPGLPMGDQFPISAESGFTKEVAGANTTFWWNHLSTGQWELGEYFGYSAAHERLAFVEAEKVRILDAKSGFVTGPQVGPGVTVSISHGRSLGYFVFQQAGEPKILFLDDLKVYNVPGAINFKVLPDSKWIYWTHFRSTETIYEFYHVPTQNRFTISGTLSGTLGAVAADSVIVRNTLRGGNWVDLSRPEAVRQIPLEVSYDKMLDQGRWLYRQEDNTIGALHYFYHTETAKEFVIQFEGMVVAVPGTDLITFDHPEQKMSWVGHAHDPAEMSAVLTTKHSRYPGISPTSRHFVGVEHGKVVIFERED